MRECAAIPVHPSESVADPDHDAISYTALKVLQQRARHCEIPMCVAMAEAAGIPWRTGRLASALKKLVGGKTQSGLYLQLRHDALSRALDDYPGCAVVELAAGFGTRGVVEHRQREAYIETDLGALLARKQQVVRKLGGGRIAPNHHFLPVNATSRGDADRLGEFVSGLGLTRPIAILHEGLLMYFSDEEQASVRDNIRALMARHKPGAVWLTPDFSERDIDRTLVQRLMSLRLGRRVGRRLNYFADEASVASFLRAGGLQGERLPNIVEPSDPARHEYAEFFRVHRITMRGNP